MTDRETDKVIDVALKCVEYGYDCAQKSISLDMAKKLILELLEIWKEG